MNPKITIVTVVYNNIEFIEETINSVINQTYNNIEYICIDGDSIDGTQDVIKKYSNNITKFVSEPDRGVYDAMNKGIEMAEGEWINFMNSGDTFASNSIIEEIFKDYRINSEVNTIYGDSNIKTSVGLFYNKCTLPFFKSKKIVKGKGFSHQSVFVRTALAKKYKFDLDFVIAADYKMIYSIFYNHKGFLYINKAIANYEVENGMSKKMQIRAWKEDAVIEGISNTFKYKFWFLGKAFTFFARKIIAKFIKLFFRKVYEYYKFKKLNKILGS